eukprot:4800629-Amphidinium_carterae.1
MFLISSVLFSSELRIVVVATRCKYQANVHKMIPTSSDYGQMHPVFFLVRCLWWFAGYFVPYIRAREARIVLPVGRSSAEIA